MTAGKLRLLSLLVAIFGFGMTAPALAKAPIYLAAKDKTTNSQALDTPNSLDPTTPDSTDPTPTETTSDGAQTAKENQKAEEANKNKDGSQATPVGNCSKSFFFFLPSPFEYVDGQGDAGGCGFGNFNFPDDIPAFALAIIDILMRVAGLVAVIAVIAGGVMYMTAGGAVERTTKARSRIINAFIGLAIVAVASAFIRFVGNQLGG